MMPYLQQREKVFGTPLYFHRKSCFCNICFSRLELNLQTRFFAFRSSIYEEHFTKDRFEFAREAAEKQSLKVENSDFIRNLYEFFELETSNDYFSAAFRANSKRSFVNCSSQIEDRNTKNRISKFFTIVEIQMFQNQPFL